MSLNAWFEEKQSAWLYRIVAAAEPDPRKQALFVELADAAEEQACIWSQQVQAAQGSLPEFRPGLRARIVAWLIRRLGPRRMRPALAAMKVRGLSVYSGHAPVPGHPMPTSAADIGHRHNVSGGNLRAAVFGVNDGLVSNASLIMGVAGASSEPKIILLSGVAGLLAGAFSMAAGEYISVRSQRELYEYQIGLERDELHQYPEEEQEELALIYAARGIPADQARNVAAELMKDPERALNALAREELGLNPEELGSPLGAAAASLASFAAGASLPLLPFLIGGHWASVPAAALVSACGLFVVGASLSLFTGRGALWSGVRMVLIGGAAGLTTYAIGSALGVSLA